MAVIRGKLKFNPDPAIPFLGMQLTRTTQGAGITNSRVVEKKLITEVGPPHTDSQPGS